MNNRTFYNEVLTDHNLHPMHKCDMPDADMVHEGINPSCGDDIWLQLKMDGDVIAGGAFRGDGCAISQASADMMLDLIIGKTKEEALALTDTFLRMIKEDISEEEMATLEEASLLQDIAHMPSRVKCAVLAWRTLEEMIAGDKDAPATTE